MINIILVEDIPSSLKEIEDIVKSFFIQCDYVYKIFTFHEYNKSFFELIDQDLENVLCLFDIETESENGIDVARKIRQYNQNIDIVFLTAHDTDEYKNKIVISNIKSMGFISKDFMRRELFNKMQEFLSNVTSQEYIHLKNGGNEYSLSVRDIYYVTTDEYEKKSLFKTVSGNILSSMPLKEIERILSCKSKYFLRVHRSYIINIFRVVTLNISKKQIIFSNQDIVTSISREKKKELESLWNEFHNIKEDADSSNKKE